MTNFTASNQTLRRRVTKLGIAVGIVVAVMFGSSTMASAESDSLSSQCIYVGGVERACAYGLYVNWGLGISWRAGGQVADSRADSWDNLVEVKLDRKWSSNTSWIQVVRAGDWSTATSSTSGYDPTYGAWVRLCTVSPSGTKYCNSSRYVTDNS